ncbi:MAG: hypothetical protein HOI56_05485 [Gammaproteobacteria bacterium]|jgi:3',5'-cyclic-AMP phosphodiesterase|nr:hypothetical protein [Gammaproteobacteria bacterium]MBT5762177.1 hypothetical protein [Gammaproteobacteria bacterium]MBT6331205.1 hypothetical protein [Gammaproteobacteria bacterium]MBT7323308.1 hypothetical protein [Gammaproteobacteria bacterium]MBT7932401.1 hypothetical protein [Gammaproteobacteria bacterium]
MMVISIFHVIIAKITLNYRGPNKVTINIIQITDLHLHADRNVSAHNINTFNSAQSVLRAIEKNERDFDMLILSGDLSDDGSTASYENLRYLLKNFDCPIYLMSGNHDSLDSIELITNKNNLKYQNYANLGKWGIFMFNTKKDNSPNGILHQHELVSFDKITNDNKDKYLLIMLHHHPVPIGSESMDTMIIENSNELLNRINHTQIKGIGWGHVHDEISIKYNGALLFSTPSTCYQAKPKSKKFSIDLSQSPGYRIISLRDDGEINTKVIRVTL